MSLLIALVIGAVIGAAGSLVLIRSLDLLMISSLVGIVGAILGLGIYALSGSDGSGSLFSAVGVLCDVVGALVLTLVFDVVHHLRSSEPSAIEPNDAESE